MWPIDDEKLYDSLTKYQETLDPETESLLISEMFYEIAYRQAVLLGYMVDIESAVQVAVVDLWQKSKPEHLRPLSQKGKRRGLPIAGFDPAVHTKPFNLYCKFARNAMRSENRKEVRRDRNQTISVGL